MNDGINLKKGYHFYKQKTHRKNKNRKQNGVGIYWTANWKFQNSGIVWMKATQKELKNKV